MATYERNIETVESENKYVFKCSNTDKICIFTDTGNLHLIKVLDIPNGKLRDKGSPIDNLGNYSSNGENIAMISSLNEILDKNLLFVTKYGMLKQVEGKEFNVTRKTVAATKLAESDLLLDVHKMEAVDSISDIVLQTNLGMFLKFSVAEISAMKKTAIGVRGIKLVKEDYIENAYIVSKQEEIVVSYKDKEVNLNKLKLAKRDTKGTKLRLS